MEVLVRKHPRYGYRRIGDLLRREGFRANPKRIYRLWKREGYRVARVQHKRRRLGAGENACHRHRPEHRNHVWALDFIFDRDEGGRSLKWLSMVCLLYTSDAADDLTRVDFGGRRIIK